SHTTPDDEELMYVTIAGLDFPGVGSNGSQPYPSNGTSTHACRSVVMTLQVLAATWFPPAYPIATRAGIPSERNITAIAAENCCQNPFFPFSRKFANPCIVGAYETVVL